jgi:hypothetical protein
VFCVSPPPPSPPPTTTQHRQPTTATTETYYYYQTPAHCLLLLWPQKKKRKRAHVAKKKTQTRARVLVDSLPDPRARLAALAHLVLLDRSTHTHTQEHKNARTHRHTCMYVRVYVDVYMYVDVCMLMFTYMLKCRGFHIVMIMITMPSAQRPGAPRQTKKGQCVSTERPEGNMLLGGKAPHGKPLKDQWKASICPFFHPCSQLRACGGVVWGGRTRWRRCLLHRRPIWKA